MKQVSKHQVPDVEDYNKAIREFEKLPKTPDVERRIRELTRLRDLQQRSNNLNKSSKSSSKNFLLANKDLFEPV